jgi:hypothetical protein
MIPVFMADLSCVCVDVLFIGGILSNLTLDIGFRLCTSVLMAKILQIHHILKEEKFWTL